LRDCVVGSGGGFEGDPVAEGRELGDVVADASLGDDAVGVVIGAEVVEAGGGVGEQVSDDDEEGARGLGSRCAATALLLTGHRQCQRHL
jgi:hypothetical protein